MEALPAVTEPFSLKLGLSFLSLEASNYQNNNEKRFNVLIGKNKQLGRSRDHIHSELGNQAWTDKIFIKNMWKETGNSSIRA